MKHPLHLRIFRLAPTCLLATLTMAVMFSGCSPKEDQEQELGYLDALKQIHAEALFREGLRGNGVKIGILDFGFAGISEDPALRLVLLNGQIALASDYTHSDSADFFVNVHGTNVLSYLAGTEPFDTVFGGSLAAGATFYLAMVTGNFDRKSDHRITEYLIDSALYDLHQRGVRLVNLSMGFWDEFENEEENYTPSDMDGRSAAVSRICQKWAMKGMIIVNSAGNTGEYRWKVIWAPSDAPDVISVGAARFPDLVFKASYSGIGNPAMSYVKPELIAYTPWGTSFSAPVVTGIIACMLQKDSTLELPRIRELLCRSGTLWPYPNNYAGYGVPDARKIVALMDHPDEDPGCAEKIVVTGKSYTLRTETRNNVVFEKKDHYRVSRQYIDEAPSGTVTVVRKERIAFTTVVTGEKAYEISWNEPSP